jgi:hypothetical protein
MKNLLTFLLVIINYCIVVITQVVNSEKICTGDSKTTCLEENNALHNSNKDGQCCWFNGTKKNENTEFASCMSISESSNNTLAELIQTYKNFSFDCPEIKVTNVEELCNLQQTKRHCLWENNKIEKEFGGKCCWINAKEQTGLQTATCMFIDLQTFNETIASLNEQLIDVQTTCDVNIEDTKQEEESKETSYLSSKFLSIVSLIVIAFIF